MARVEKLRSSAARWGAVGVLVVAALGVGTLVAQAYQHTSAAPTAGRAAPVPTFTLGVQTPTPTPTPTPAPVVDRAAERFLATGSGAGANTWWRGVAGACGTTPPLVERSTDGGVTWTSVTPADAAQLASIQVFEQTEVDLVVGVGPSCQPQAVRTYTQGEFWEASADLLASSRFVSLTDPATVTTPAGPIAAPCASPVGLSSLADRLSVVCDGVAHVSAAAGAWVALPVTDAVAAATGTAGVVVAHAVDGCPGISLTLFAGGDPSQPQPARCVEGLDAAQPTAVAASDAGIVLWSGASLLVVP